MRAARPSRRTRLRALALPLLGLLTGCATRVPLSTTAGPPLPDLAGVHASLTRSCAAVTTLTAELALSGRSGGQRVRGRAVAGFALPDAMRLEGVAPFGAPVFLMVARGGTATLVLPREHAAAVGKVHFFRPSDSHMDREFALKLDAAGRQTIDVQGLGSGRWRIRVEWAAGGETYFREENVVLGR